jgi:hypothetical protein
LVLGVGVAEEPPAALDGFGQQYPDPRGVRRITGGLQDEVDYRNVDGIIVPTTRWAYAPELGDQPTVAIDITDITIH